MPYFATANINGEGHVCQATVKKAVDTAQVARRHAVKVKEGRRERVATTESSGCTGKAATAG